MDKVQEIMGLVDAYKDVSIGGFSGWEERQSIEAALRELVEREPLSEYFIQPNKAMTNMHIEPAELIRVTCASGSTVVIKDDYHLYVEDGAYLQEAADELAHVTFRVIKNNKLINNKMKSFLQIRSYRGGVLNITMDGVVEASAEWPQETVEFAEMIGKAMLNRINNTPAKQAIEAMELALSSYGTQLLSYPPQEAWIARDVSYKLRAAIAALAAQAAHGIGVK